MARLGGPEGSKSFKHPNPITVTYDLERDVICLEGVEYSCQLFREWARSGFPVGTIFRVYRNPSDVLEIDVLEER